MDDRVRLGISTCLLGEKVRFDGGHKRDPYLTETLGAFVEYVPVCPEVECGFPIPREPLRLVGDPEAPRLVTVRTMVDHTERMVKWAEKRLAELEGEGLCGFVFKSKSPSSGMARVKVYAPNGVPSHKGVGIFARKFMERFPYVPVEEEGRLHDPAIRENFIERVFALKRWQDLSRKRKRVSELVDFHTRHKLQILSHSQQHYQQMGRLVARAKDLPVDELYERYLGLFMEALRLRATVKKNVNVLQHMVGFFKKELTKDEKAELLETIDYYHRGLVPLIVPITLMNHYVRKYGQPYLAVQTYLRPHPFELSLRNHV